MAIITETTSNPSRLPAPTKPTDASSVVFSKLDSRLKQVKLLTDQGLYQRAFDTIPNNSSDMEVLNCRAVCLMRMGKFAQAIAPLRSVALNMSTFHLRPEIPEHIKINYAIALFFGGEPAGGLDALADIRARMTSSSDASRARAKAWAASMNWLRRLTGTSTALHPSLVRRQARQWSATWHGS
ncbi:MAG: hypothetical protein R3C56_29260 [Pirellulaceae bacterium]